MTDVRKIRELIDLVVSEVRDPPELDQITVGVVLMVLDSHNLLTDFEGDAEWYHLRVQQAYRDALRTMFGEG